MNKINVEVTKHKDLCVSCGICSSVCPANAITIEFKEGQFQPAVNKELCEKFGKCSLCLDCCPGIDIYAKGTGEGCFFEGKRPLVCYTAYSNNFITRKNSTSGGIVTEFVANLIKNKEYDFAFVLNFEKFSGEPATLEAADDIAKIYAAAKPKYIPASVHRVIDALKDKKSKRFIIVGTPCQTLGVKKYIKKMDIPKEDVLLLGLFCQSTMNYNIIKFYEDTFRKNGERLEKFFFRTKEQKGWPGDSKLIFDSGREIFINKDLRISLKKFFQLNRCLFCKDKFNQHADISFGDCYLSLDDDYLGKSNIIIWSKVGHALFNKYSFLFSLSAEEFSSIKQSQGAGGKKPLTGYYKVTFPMGFINLKILQHTLRLGKLYRINTIKLILFFSSCTRVIKLMIKHLLKAIYHSFTLLLFFFHTALPAFNKKRTSASANKCQNVIITGGGFFNKGAEAMLFTVVDQLKKRFPNKDIYLFSAYDFVRLKDKDIYSFNMLPWEKDVKMGLLGFSLYKFLSEKKLGNSIFNKILKVIVNTDLIIDISGLSLSSDQGHIETLEYLLNLAVAKKYSISYIILPQSIGPFDYPVFQKRILLFLIKKYLRYPKKIFIRENISKLYLEPFKLMNLDVNYDIVLTHDVKNTTNIYLSSLNMRSFDISPGSICIIPNQKVIKSVGEEVFYSTISQIIKLLLEANRSVYLLSYSSDDLSICQRMKDLFLDIENVYLIEEDLDAVILEKLIGKFDFIIASRYHAIIHAFKNSVPVVALGWAEKYNFLINMFSQVDYFLDTRKGFIAGSVIAAVEKMLKNHKYESENIANIKNSLSASSVFDCLIS